MSNPSTPQKKNSGWKEMPPKCVGCCYFLFDYGCCNSRVSEQAFRSPDCRYNSRGRTEQDVLATARKMLAKPSELREA